MKSLTIILSALILGLLTLSMQDISGKKLFEHSCSSCHSQNKIMVGPPFQRIRKDYGLNWTFNFLTHYDSVLKAKEPKSLYIYYVYNKTQQNRFPFLTKRDIAKILDYVDSFPYDSTQYEHRKLGDEEKLKFIHNYEEKEMQQQRQIENTPIKIIEDTLAIEDTVKGWNHGSSGYGTTKTKVKSKHSKTQKRSKKKNGG